MTCKRDAHGVAGAARRVLHDEAQVGRCQRLLHGRRAVADDDGNRLRRQGACRVQHVRDQRPPGERMQDLRQRGVHALAQPGGKHDDMNRNGHDAMGCFSTLRMIPRALKSAGVRSSTAWLPARA